MLRLRRRQTCASVHRCRRPPRPPTPPTFAAQVALWDTREPSQRPASVLHIPRAREQLGEVMALRAAAGGGPTVVAGYEGGHVVVLDTRAPAAAELGRCHCLGDAGASRADGSSAPPLTPPRTPRLLQCSASTGTRHAGGELHAARRRRWCRSSSPRCAATVARGRAARRHPSCRAWRAGRCRDAATDSAALLGCLRRPHPRRHAPGCGRLLGRKVRILLLFALEPLTRDELAREAQGPTVQVAQHDAAGHPGRPRRRRVPRRVRS